VRLGVTAETIITTTATAVHHHSRQHGGCLVTTEPRNYSSSVDGKLGTSHAGDWSSRPSF
jgi:hypothetical protein